MSERGPQDPKGRPTPARREKLSSQKRFERRIEAKRQRAIRKASKRYGRMRLEVLTPSRPHSRTLNRYRHMRRIVRGTAHGATK